MWRILSGKRFQGGFSSLKNPSLIILKEATENSASLDDDPIMLARLIQMCYTGDYGNTKSENIFTVMLENALFLGRMRGFANHNNLQNDSGDCVLHAKMYALSDKYDFGRARVLAAAKLRARVCAEDIKSDEVLAAAKIIYSMTPQSSGRNCWAVGSSPWAGPGRLFPQARAISPCGLRLIQI
jgi:hypothetical protein